MKTKFTPEELIRFINRGYWFSCALSTALDLNLFNILSNSSMTIDQLTKRIRVNYRGLTTLLRFLQAMDLVSKKNNMYSITKISKKFFSVQSKFYLGYESKISKNLWKEFESLTLKVSKGNKINDSRKYFTSLNHSEQKGFLETMHSQGLKSSKIIEKKINLKNKKMLLDVGCGLGTYSVPLLIKQDKLKAVLIDSISVIRYAKKFLIKEKFYKRINFFGIDFFKEIPNFDYDIVLLSKILHDWDDNKCIKLLRNISKVMKLRGTLIIHEEIITNDNSPNFWPAILDLFLFTIMGNAKTRTKKEIEFLLTLTGFKMKKIEKINEYTSIIIATKVK